MKTKKNALEWSVFAVSVVLIATVVALLVASGVQSKGTDPELHVSIGPTAVAAGAYRVPVSVKNEGDETAEDARVEVLLLAEGREVERAELTLAWIPRRSRQEGWVVFRHDPRCCEIVARAVGFQKP